MYTGSAVTSSAFRLAGLACFCLGLGFFGIHFVCLFEGGSATTQSCGYPVLTCGVLVTLLSFEKQFLHRRAQLSRQLTGRFERLDGLTDGNRDWSIGAAQPLRVPLGPHALCTPDRDGNDGNTGLDGHAGSAGLEFLDLEASADRGLGIHTDQFAALEEVDGRLIGISTGTTIDGDVLEGSHDGPGNLVVENFLLGHEPDVPLRGARRQTRVGEVHVSGVVDRDHRTTGSGDIPITLNRELQAFEREDGTGDADDCSVYGVHRFPA